MTGTRPAGSRPAAWVSVAVLVAIIAPAVIWPVVSVLMGIVDAESADGPDMATIQGGGAALLVRTIAVSALIGVIATALAWPAAWALRDRPVWAPIVLTPMLMPAYLCYSGWGLVRAPETWLGGLLARGPAEGVNWWPVAADRVLAIVGLSLWAWPVAAIILARTVRGIDARVLESIRLESGSRWRRSLTLVSLARSGLLGGAVLVALVMLGSAVPLHLAQFDTYAMRIWLLLAQVPPDGTWRVWIASWPIVLIGVVCGWLVGSRVLRMSEDPEPETGSGGSRSGPWSAVVTAGIWLCSVLVPLLLFALSIREPVSLARFWAVSGGALAASVGVGAGVGVLGALVSAMVWLGLGSDRARVRATTGWCVRLLIISALLPGVLVGSAAAGAWNRAGWFWWVGQTPAALILVHTARYGAVAALFGWWMARSERRAHRELRRIDGADGLRGWLGACLPTQGWALLASGLVMAVLSTHEIESAVMVQPPGVPSLARQILGYLHYSRTEEMSVAAVYLIGGGLAAALVASGSLILAGRYSSSRGGPAP